MHADDEPAIEGDRAWRERTQQTNEQAEDLQPPHDDEGEQGWPAPARPADGDQGS